MPSPRVQDRRHCRRRLPPARVDPRSDGGIAHGRLPRRRPRAVSLARRTRRSRGCGCGGRWWQCWCASARWARCAERACGRHRHSLVDGDGRDRPRRRRRPTARSCSRTSTRSTAGAEFPDGGYWTRSAGTPGGDYGEEAHWQRFVKAYTGTDPRRHELRRPDRPGRTVRGVDRAPDDGCSFCASANVVREAHDCFHRTRPARSRP